MIQPDYPSEMALLSHLNSDELKEMLNDDAQFNVVLKDVKQVSVVFYSNYTTLRTIRQNVIVTQ